MYKYKVLIQDGGFRYYVIIRANSTLEAQSKVTTTISGRIVGVECVDNLEPTPDNIIRVDFKRKVRMYV